MVLTGGMRLLSGLTLSVLSPPLAKPLSIEVKDCYTQDSLVRGYLPVLEEQLLKEHGAITTWGSVFSNPTLKNPPTFNSGSLPGHKFASCSCLRTLGS